MPGTPESDEGSSVLMALVPLFVGLILSLVQLELDWWFQRTFTVSLYLEDKTWDSIDKLNEKRIEYNQKKREQE